jgi:hypothetical protein
MDMMEASIDRYVSRINNLDFVKAVDFARPSRSHDQTFDGTLKIRTPKGTYAFVVETKTSYLDRSVLNALINRANARTTPHREPLLLLARYVPAPSAEKLIEAGINFVDLAGNMHLALNKDYVRTVLGNKETRAQSSRILTPARIQLLFALAAKPEAANWSVRQLSDIAGVGKSNVAQLRRQLVAGGLLKSSKRGYALAPEKELEEELLRGYDRILRPKLLIGRFRTQESAPEALFKKLKPVFGNSSVEWSITGGPAASLLQHFYQGIEVPVFVNVLPDEAKRELRMLPDKAGPIIFLRAFGQLTRWRNIQGMDIPHPWLVYAELMQSEDPRAHEAAALLKREFLNAA